MFAPRSDSLDVATPLRAGPLVRGLCPAGHVLETRAAKGRTTWRGPCPHKLGPKKTCGLFVTARRVAEPGAGAGPLEPLPIDAAGADPPPVRKVARYVDHGLDPARPDEPGFSDPELDPEPEPEPVREPESGDTGVQDPDPAAGGPARPEPDQHPPPRPRRNGLAGVIDRWRAAGLDLDGPEDDWTIPGIYP